MSRKIYIYPTHKPGPYLPEDYLQSFHDAFRAHPGVRLVNRGGRLGVASLFLNLDARVFIIHWVDLIVFKKFGRLQFLVFLAGIWTLIGLRKQIVWVLHNRQAHNGPHPWVDFAMSLMAKHAHLVLTHSEAGVAFFREQYGACDGDKVFHLPLPAYRAEIVPAAASQWDYVIWGSITPRKRVAEFLEYATQEPFFRDKRILVCGICLDPAYARRIACLAKGPIEFIQKFLAREELDGYLARSTCILFTYSPASVLSSVALVYSLNFNKPIIGPAIGNFLDLKGVVQCYRTFAELPGLDIAQPPDTALIQRYLAENTWARFPQKLLDRLESGGRSGPILRPGERLTGRPPRGPGDRSARGRSPRS
ncbi:MAG TPA: hypothetical protein PL039_04990 [Kiritimatiellia bacterium]|nr:glycosyltransferase family 4 protein [Lentisphaerota bacterium]HPC19542.1 hypothetical protein [Kiritimatiellia bacterium]